MDKYAFLTDTESFNEALGIPEKRFKEIVKTCRIAIVEGENKVSALEYAMNKVDPKNTVEAAFLGYVLCSVLDAEISPLKAIVAVMSRMRGGDDE